MTSIGIFNILFFFLVILAITKPIGLFMVKLFQGERTLFHPAMRPLERLVYRMGGVREDEEQHWTQYAVSLIVFSLVGFLIVYAIQRLQRILPFNPNHFGTGQAPSGATALSPDLAFNTAVSFVTNTNWQNYSGESTLSYFVQMAALTVQNFLSAAVGVAVSIALVRGFARKQVQSIGNFWVDVTRGTLYLFLPFALVAALFICSQGVLQNFRGNLSVKTVEGATQVIPQGPVASQESIKIVGTNGGGFFGANSAHPFENPNPLTNMFQLLMIFGIPAGLTYTFGKMVGDTRQGWALFAAMSALFLAGIFVAYPAEQAGNPIVANLGVQTAATHDQPGGNMEGKEVRYGIASSALYAVVTTDTSCGAVNSQHDSFTPLGGLVPLFNLHMGEVVFGGVGAGLKGMLLFAIVAVFIAGLMVGRTPEYIGKKIEQKEVKMAMLALILMAANILVFTGVSSVAKFKKDGYLNPPGPAVANVNNNGPHGFSEILYLYSSQNANNGSAFGGINGNTPWYNLTGGIAMLIGRFLFIIPMLAVAGSLAAKKTTPATSGTLPTHGALFVSLLVGTVVIVGALTFFPALSLGPIVEHFLMHEGRLFSTLLFPIWS
jgi:K+-transporting ATPase ATPase A chain